jgi:hypothetical protein
MTVHQAGAPVTQDWSEGALRHMPYGSLAVFGFSRGATEARVRAPADYHGPRALTAAV